MVKCACVRSGLPRSLQALQALAGHGDVGNPMVAGAESVKVGMSVAVKFGRVNMRVVMLVRPVAVSSFSGAIAAMGMSMDMRVFVHALSSLRHCGPFRWLRDSDAVHIPPNPQVPSRRCRIPFAVESLRMTLGAG